MQKRYQNGMSANSYTEVIPYHIYRKEDAGWRDGMVTANGRIGVVCAGAPYNETMIYQNIDFLMPTEQPRETPKEVGNELEEARQAVIHLDDSWDVHARVRTYLYAFHPGHQLRLSRDRKTVTDYVRTTDFEKAELSVEYADEDGNWVSRTFCSREDNAVITEITKSDTKVKINMEISIDDVSAMHQFGTPKHGIGSEVNMIYKKNVDENGYISLVGHYPAFEGSELSEGGYAGVSKIIHTGGTATQIELPCGMEEAQNVGRVKNPAFQISGADVVTIITKTGCTRQMGEAAAFAESKSYEIVSSLQADIEKVIEKYTGSTGVFSYDGALKKHAEKQAALFCNVTFALGNGTDKGLSNEELLLKQNKSDRLLEALVERAYNNGRYVQICCGGESAPRLCGMWTGEWNPGWRGAYTMDANVNIQAAGMNTGNIYNAGVGYLHFVLKQLEDWEENAALVYGMKDAIQVPVNTDGVRAVMVEYDKEYPFQYWNAGASWMILPIFELWQCFGNQTIMLEDKSLIARYGRQKLKLAEDILYPILLQQANFWEQLCTPAYYTDAGGKACHEKDKKELADGEKYLLIPSYSPENTPGNYKSAITANAAMDISAARYGLEMALVIAKEVSPDTYEENAGRWNHLLERLPSYKYDNTGALCEWAMEEYEENNAHRHISHLYCAWPSYETQSQEKLTKACSQALLNRDRENAGKDDTASHGWIHRAFVAARLKDGDGVYRIIKHIMSSDIFYTSLMTDHNTNRCDGVFCTDTCLGMVGVINEALLYSNTGQIELLPALPTEWKEGEINGLLARTRAQVTRLAWNLDKKQVHAAIRSMERQEIRVSCGVGTGSFTDSDGMTCKNHSLVSFEPAEERVFVYEWV